RSGGELQVGGEELRIEREDVVPDVAPIAARLGEFLLQLPLARGEVRHGLALPPWPAEGLAGRPGAAHRKPPGAMSHDTHDAEPLAEHGRCRGAWKSWRPIRCFAPDEKMPRLPCFRRPASVGPYEHREDGHAEGRPDDPG